MQIHESPAPAGYELVRPIGSGASSVVWEAVQLSTGRAVALKLLEADISDEQARRRFDRERDAMTALAAHAGIVTIHDAGIEGGRPWIAMEMCHRGSLAQHVAATGPLDPGTAAAVLGRLAAALHQAHSAGVVHCDVKPANVLLTDGGEPALGDFGIARVSVGRATTTTVGGFSLDHVAPELLDDGRASELSDVYSLGTTVWELATGRPPFRAESDVSVAAVIKRIMIKPLPALPPGHDGLDAILQTMTRKDPADRVPSMLAVAEQARVLEAALPARPDGPPFPASHPLPGSGRSTGAVTGGETILRARRAGPRPAEIDIAAPVAAPRRLTPLVVAGIVATVLLLGAGTLGYVTLGRPSPLPVAAPLAQVATDPSPTPAAVPAPAPDESVSGVQIVSGPAAGSGLGASGRGGTGGNGSGGGAPTDVQIPTIGTDLPTVPLPVPDKLEITTAKLPAAAVDAAYSGTLAATGGTTPYVWSITSGGLPAGLTLNGSGVIAGTPSTPTPATFSITVTDRAGVSTTKRLTLSPAAIVGDINKDGPVDCVDKNILVSQFNQTGRNLSGDLNDSGKVDIQDLSILLSHWTGNGDGSAC